MPDLPTTQRAYTLRLRGVSQDQAWRMWLWKTHEAVNHGARVFGDWLLTLRGGLDHRLADDVPEPSEAEINKEVERLKKTSKDTAESNLSEDDPTGEDARQLLIRQRHQDRRIILALSWLCVEDAHFAPKDESVRIVAGNAPDRAKKVIAALVGVLNKRGVSETEIGNVNLKSKDQPGTWIADCEPSLVARIRDDAVWINRSAAFESASAVLGESLMQSEIWDFLGRFITKTKYFEMPVIQSGKESSTDAGAESGRKEKDADLAKEANGWLCDRFGTRPGSNFSAKAAEYRAFAKWCRTIELTASAEQLLKSLLLELAAEKLPKRLAATPGESNAVQLSYAEIVNELRSGNLPTRDDWSKLAELADERAVEKTAKVGKKHKAEWASRILAQVEKAVGFNYIDPVRGTKRGWEYAVILDHAARKVCMAHSWVKRAEVTRRKLLSDSQKIHRVPQAVQDYLDDFCRQRTSTTGAIEPYRIRPAAIEGWDEIVKRWAAAKCSQPKDCERLAVEQNVDREEWLCPETGSCFKACLNRVALFKEVLESDEVDKPGDAFVFTALAANDATGVWWDDRTKTAHPEWLRDYVKATDAMAKRGEYKVPAYRHPDELRHPVFCDFGKSQWTISFAEHRNHSQLDAAEQAVARGTAAVEKATAKIEKAKTDDKRLAAEKELVEAQQKFENAHKKVAWLQTPKGLKITLFDGASIEEKDLRWASIRLEHDLDLKPESAAVPRPSVSGPDGETETARTLPDGRGTVGPSAALSASHASAKPITATRADRYGRAVAGAKGDDRIEVDGLFGLEEWNGRLQAPRAELDAIADVRDGRKALSLSESDRAARVRDMQDRLHWFITFSSRLTPRGEFVNYAMNHLKKHPAERVLKVHADKETLRQKWMTSADRWTARAGWQLTAGRVVKSPEGLDLVALLDRIEKEMAAASEVQWTMNMCLAEIGIHFPKHRKRALAIGEKLGIYRDYPCSKGCTSPFAPIWINEMVRRQS